MDNPFDQFDDASPSANPFDQLSTGPTIQAANQQADEAMASPEANKLRGELQSFANKELLKERGLGPGYAAASGFGNAAFLNLPRNLIAGGKSLASGRPFSEEYDTLKRIDEAAAEQYPRATTGGEVAGALGQAFMLPQAAPGSFLAKTLARRAMTGGAMAGGLAGAETYADTKSVPEALEKAGYASLFGLGVTPLAEKALAPAIRFAGEKAGKMAPLPKALKRDELFDVGSKAYEAVDNAGVMFKHEPIKGLYDDIAQGLWKRAYSPKGDNSSVNTALSELYKLSMPSMGGAPSYPTFTGLERIRQLAQEAVTAPGPENKRTRMLGGVIKSKIDNFIKNFDEANDVLPGGDPALAKSLIGQARDYWARGSKVQAVEDALTKADWRAGSTYSGGNVNNASRQNLRRLLEQDLKTPGRWKPDELQALENTVMGDTVGNTARYIGNKLGPSGLMGGAELIGGTSALLAGHPQVAAGIWGLAGLGAGAKALGERKLRNSVDDLTTLIASGGNRAAMPQMGVNELQGARNLAMQGAPGAAGQMSQFVSPAVAETTPRGVDPAAADVARGGQGGATPNVAPSGETTSQAPSPAAAAPNEWARQAPKQLPFGQVFVRDKKTGQTRIFDRTRGVFIGETAAQ